MISVMTSSLYVIALSNASCRLNFFFGDGEADNSYQHGKKEEVNKSKHTIFLILAVPYMHFKRPADFFIGISILTMLSIIELLIIRSLSLAAATRSGR